MEILGDDRIRAIRHTVLLQVTRAHVRGDDFQVAAFSATSASAREFPLSQGITLPACCGTRLRLEVTEVEQPRLCSRVELRLEGVVVFPGNVYASRLADDISCAIGFALLARSFVLCGIPGISHTLPFGVQRNARMVAFGRSDHAPAPV